MQLSPVQQRFVLHWGEMGAKWGINRTVAQIHALLFLSPDPLAADQIVEALGVARSNVSVSLKELQGWSIVRVAHVLGDRRDRFETQKDVWELFRIILEERKRREIDPTIATLRKCFEEADADRGEHPYTREQIGKMLEFLDLSANWYAQLARLPTKLLIRFVRMASRIPKWVRAAT